MIMGVDPLRDSKPKALKRSTTGSTPITSAVRAVGLNVVVVDQDGQVAEPEMAGRHGRFPDLALL